MKTRILWLLVFPLVVLCGFGKASACQCIWNDTPTVAFRKFPAVFVGTAKSATSRAGMTFVVDEALKGVKKGEVNVYTGGGCGTSFKEGARYLVYAYFEDEEKKYYATDMCTRTRLAEIVEDELAVLRSVANGAFEPRIYGRVEEIVRGIKLEYKENVPLPGIKVIANNGVNTYQTVTDKDGRFRFVNVDFEDFVWLKTDANGEFSARCLEGLTYRFAVFANDYNKAAAEVYRKIDASASMPVELVLKQ